MSKVDIDFAEIERLIEDGATYRDIAEQIGISHYELDVLAGAMGTARSKMLLKRQVIAEMYAGDSSVKEIAKAVGLKPQTVRMRLTKMKHHIK